MDKEKRFGNLAKRPFIKGLFICLILSLILLFFMMNRELFAAIIAGDAEEIRSLLKENFVKSYLTMMIIMIIQNTFTIVPLVLVITVNIALFGFVNGFLWSWATSILASILVFTGTKYAFRDWILKRFNRDLIHNIEENGFVYVFQSRIFPFVPTSLINILAGVSSIRFKDFLFGTIIGNFIYFFLLALIPAGIMSSSMNEFVLGIIILLVFTLYYSFRKVKRKSEPSIKEKKKQK